MTITFYRDPETNEMVGSGFALWRWDVVGDPVDRDRLYREKYPGDPETWPECAATHVPNWGRPPHAVDR